MSPFQDTLIFHADFNSLAPDGRISVTQRYASSARKPEVGEWVLLQDDEGNRYSALVVKVGTRIAETIADMSSWRPGGAVERTDTPVIEPAEPLWETSKPDPEAEEPQITVVG